MRKNAAEMRKIMPLFRLPETVLQARRQHRQGTPMSQPNFDFILFGATGDLAMRKLLPAL